MSLPEQLFRCLGYKNVLVVPFGVAYPQFGVQERSSYPSRSSFIAVWGTRTVELSLWEQLIRSLGYKKGRVVPLGEAFPLSGVQERASHPPEATFPSCEY